MSYIKVSCKYYVGLHRCNNEISCVSMFGVLAARDEHCYNFNIDWVRFILYHEHLIELKNG